MTGRFPVEAVSSDTEITLRAAAETALDLGGIRSPCRHDREGSFSIRPAAHETNCSGWSHLAS